MFLLCFCMLMQLEQEMRNEKLEMGNDIGISRSIYQNFIPNSSFLILHSKS